MIQSEILCPDCFRGKLLIKEGKKEGICPLCEEEFIVVDYERNCIRYAPEVTDFVER